VVTVISLNSKETDSKGRKKQGAGEWCMMHGMMFTVPQRDLILGSRKGQAQYF
jgi:hypothetical protein